MHLEEKNKVQNKGLKSTTALHIVHATSADAASKKTLVHSLKTANTECAASLTSQNTSPTTWAGRLERENSGFSV